MSDAKFNIFKIAVQAGQYEIDDSFLNFLIESIKKAGFDQPTIVTQNVNVPTPAIASVSLQQTKKLTGYNIFMREMMSQYKTEGVPTGDRMTKVSIAWKALTEEQQNAWKVKASLTEPVTFTAKAQPAKKGPKTMTGYQLFVQQQMPTIKVDNTISAKDRLTVIGQRWKALKAEEQALYKTNAGIADAAKKNKISV